ncbi:MAG: hypothetical protein KAR87_04595 [Candidatus Aenigmarchaeota archaeon]|nr:hypothetical protein [Candidatus Aenigmarchaeota archaeon]
MKLKIYLLSFFVLCMVAAYFIWTGADVPCVSSAFSNNTLVTKVNSFVENPSTIPVYLIILPFAVLIALLLFLFLKKDEKEASVQSEEIDKLLRESVLLNEQSQNFSKTLKETIGELIMDDDTGIYKDQKNELNEMIYEFMDAVNKLKKDGLFNKKMKNDVMKIITELGIAKKMNDDDSDNLAQIEKSKKMIEDFLDSGKKQANPKKTKTSKKKVKKKI